MGPNGMIIIYTYISVDNVYYQTLLTYNAVTVNTVFFFASTLAPEVMSEISGGITGLVKYHLIPFLGGGADRLQPDSVCCAVPGT